MPQVARTDHDRQRIGQQRSHERRCVGLLRRPRCNEQHQRQPLKAPSEIAEPAQGRLVSPVHIVNDQKRRVAKGKVRGEPIEPVQLGERRIACLAKLARRRRRKQRRGELGRTRQQLGSDVRRRIRKRRLEQLTDDAKRELALELARTGEQHPHPGSASAGSRLAQQARLAYPRTSLDRDQQAVARAGGVERPLQRSELRITFEEERRSDPRRLLSHSASALVHEPEQADVGRRARAGPMPQRIEDGPRHLRPLTDGSSRPNRGSACPSS